MLTVLFIPRFREGQRVRVLWCARDEGTPVNAVGTVVRLRRADEGAWIALDKRHEHAAFHPFPAEDESGRGTHLLAYPDECEAIVE
jgi:hypothetical protein